MQLTEEEYQQREESVALDLSAASQISVSNLKHISFGTTAIPIPPTVTINDEWYGTPCSLSPLRGRLVAGITILCKDEGVKTTLLTFTSCTIPACKGDLYKNPDFNITGKQMEWTMEPLGSELIGFSVHFTMGMPPRLVAVILSDFPIKVQKRVGVCTWNAS